MKLYEICVKEFPWENKTILDSSQPIRNDNFLSSVIKLMLTRVAKLIIN